MVPIFNSHLVNEWQKHARWHRTKILLSTDGYDNAYDWEFVTIVGASDKLILKEESEDFIVVLPNIIQHGCISSVKNFIRNFCKNSLKMQHLRKNN